MNKQGAEPCPILDRALFFLITKKTTSYKVSNIGRKIICCLVLLNILS
jgi:hypothetical protein